MTEEMNERVICQVCKKEMAYSEVLPAEMIRGNILEAIRKRFPEWSPSGFICIADLNRFRAEYIEDILEDSKGQLSEVEKDVLNSLQQQELLSVNPDVEFDRALTLGEKLADRIADFGGSWRFFGIFTVILIIWLFINSTMTLRHPFDPYPYILLNLVLSCLAAVQAPVIMMSQNRQEARDRLRSEHDYQINLKAELEIRLLNEKTDRMLYHQWHRLLEIQQIQTDLLEEFTHTHPR